MDGCKTAGDLLEVNIDYPLLNLSLHLILVSYISSADENVDISQYKGYLKELQNSFYYSRALCQYLSNRFDFDEIIFLKGRDPGQAGVRYFAESKNISWHALEHGITPGITFHLENFQTQDRLAIQARMLEASIDMTASQISFAEEWYKTWSFRQRVDKDHNPNVRSGAVPPELMGAKGRLIPISTTSLDEDVSSVGYSRIDLREMVQKTLSAAKVIEDAGIKPVIVIHPNSLNKSWMDLRVLYFHFSRSTFTTIFP